MQIDFEVSGGGSVYPLRPLTRHARVWVDEHLPDDATSEEFLALLIVVGPLAFVALWIWRACRTVTRTCGQPTNLNRRLPPAWKRDQRKTKMVEVSLDVERAPRFPSAVDTTRAGLLPSFTIPTIRDHAGVGMLDEEFRELA